MDDGADAERLSSSARRSGPLPDWRRPILERPFPQRRTGCRPEPVSLISRPAFLAQLNHGMDPALRATGVVSSIAMFKLSLVTLALALAAALSAAAQDQVQKFKSGTHTVPVFVT